MSTYTMLDWTSDQWRVAHEWARLNGKGDVPVDTISDVPTAVSLKQAWQDAHPGQYGPSVPTEPKQLEWVGEKRLYAVSIMLQDDNVTTRTILTQTVQTSETEAIERGFTYASIKYPHVPRNNMRVVASEIDLPTLTGLVR